jgi:DNA-binding NarL/FixJ family response regulator
MKPASVLLVEDEDTARELLARGLARLGHTVMSARDGAEALPLLNRTWDVIVTDLVMPRVDGLALLAEINQRCPRALRVVITSFADKDRVVAVLNLGADYLVEKPFGVQRLADIIERLITDRQGEPPDKFAQFFQRRLRGLPLSPREREVVGLLLQGLANKEIAQRLGIGEQTVKNALSGAYQRLGVTSRGELFHVVFPV